MIRSEKGFTLIEVLVSIVVLSIVSFSLLNIFAQSLKTTSDNLQTTIANQVAQSTLHTLDRRASVLTEDLTLNQLIPSTPNCPFCTEINGEEYIVSVEAIDASTLESTLLNVEVSVSTETMTEPIILKGAISNASLRNPFPETAIPESEQSP